MTIKNKPKNDRDKMLKNIMDKEKFLTPESDINFKCNACGKCCHNQDIILSTLDIVRLRCALNIPTPALFKDYITIHKGHSSKLPVCMLEFKPMPFPENTSMTICPFLKPIFHKEVDKISKENKTEKEYIKEMTAVVQKNVEKGSTASICSIHKYRPEVCRLYPLGRGFMCDKKTKKQTIKFFQVEREMLPCDDSCYLHKNKVKDFLSNNQIPEYAEIQKKYNSCIMKLADVSVKKEFSENDYTKITNLLYNFDYILMGQVVDARNKEKMPEKLKEKVKKMQELHKGIPLLDKDLFMKSKDVKKICNYLLNIQEKEINKLINKYAKRSISTQKRV